MKEIFKDIYGYEGLYQVSNFGRIKSLPKKRRNVLTGGFSVSKTKILTPVEHKNKYLFVDLYNNEGNKIKSIHRLVAIAFIPNHENKPQINHKDGNKQNNHVDNLEWVTVKENIIHSVQNGFSHTKLLPGDVRVIRRLLLSGYRHNDIANMFNVKRCVISDISANRTFNHVR